MSNKINLLITKANQGRWEYIHHTTSSQIELSLTKMEEWEIQGQEAENKQTINLDYQDISSLIDLLEKLRE